MKKKNKQQRKKKNKNKKKRKENKKKIKKINKFDEKRKSFCIKNGQGEVLSQKMKSLYLFCSSLNLKPNFSSVVVVWDNKLDGN